MSYIRKNSELRTGYQEIEPWSPTIDLQCDFVMVYGIDATMPERIHTFLEKGYIVHLMTGCSWGEYEDYLTGKWDGKEHWDERQMKRNGELALHGISIPYMVPTISFAKYLTEKLKVAVDSGVEGIHMEEPEFWDNTGYSKAFQREYKEYYREEWEAPHSSLLARYRCARLKAYLYSRAISYISRELKRYAKDTYGQEVKFYVPTHSLVNYTQWKIISPESELIHIPTVDGYIAQVWTGTSGTGNVYQGYYESRTFETAFLEYGVMQELVKNTGRIMWFLHDPVEDFPEYTWETYCSNYLKTVVASLFQPKISRYEVCPWPNRVMNGIYPRKLGMASGMIPTTDLEGAQAIPKKYSSLLASMTQLLGDMEQTEYSFDNADFGVGIFMSDSCLYQRSYPDHILSMNGEMIHTLGDEEEMNASLVTLADRQKREEDIEKDRQSLMTEIDMEWKQFYAYTNSCAFPNFFGMSLPLLKYGLPVRPVQLDNITRFTNYLEDYRYLILSYEYMKPDGPLQNQVLADWVRDGGVLIYVGDESDPYHKMQAWWNQNTYTYESPVKHLFACLGLLEGITDGVYQVGKGHFAFYSMAPARITLNIRQADAYRTIIRNALKGNGDLWKYHNQIVMRRGPYIIATVMKESCSEEATVLHGMFVDLLNKEYPVITEKIVRPDENAILLDLEKVKQEQLKVIGSCARVLQLECESNQFHAMFKAADQIRVYIRIRLPKQVTKLVATDEKEQAIPLTWRWDEESRTVLLSYDSRNEIVNVQGRLEPSSY